MYTILVCEDDKEIRSALRIYLEKEHYQVLQAENGQEVLDILAKEEIHLVLLDVMMPVLDGIDTAIKIRESSNLPIIFLSAKSEEVDRILGLKVGADDYITKPFVPKELVARVDAALRRYIRLGGLGQTAQIEEKQVGIYQNGDLIINDQQKKVTMRGREITVTAIEYKILLFLIQNLEYVMSSEQIYEAAWGEMAFQVTKTVSVHIRHIREKIEINPNEPEYLKVIYGLGYKLVKKL